MFACENEVEVNAEFEEKTFVLGLLNAQSDTQFVKITKTFLDNTTGAVQLAQDPNNLYYDSLDVTLSKLNGNNNVSEQFKLSKIIRRKDQGLFTTERNEAYYTDEEIEEGANYVLTIDKLDGARPTTGDVVVTEGVRIVKPASINDLTFIDFRGNVIDYTFDFETADGIGEFSAVMTFRYTEINNVDSTIKTINIPLSSFLIPSLNKSKPKFPFDSQRFFDALEANVPANVNSPRRIINDNCMIVTVEAADAEYTLYRDVNGPIDGLAQTRPEFTNITRGLGLFASRSTSITTVSLNDDTKNYILANYGNRVDNLPKFRGFEVPR